MSTPSSRLSKFRSYSYYHVLAMCDSSATANELAKSTDVDVWMHATPSTAAQDQTTQQLGPYAPKPMGIAGRYVILINGATDAAYSIVTAKWASATAAQAVHKDRTTSIAVEGSVTIHEPKGVAFLDQVVKCSVALGVNSAQVVYVLKTFFVGHVDDGTTNIITDIPPLNFIVYDATGAFTESGGTYEMLFVGAAHGASRLPQYSKAVNSMNITSGANLEETLRNLQHNINNGYDKYYNCVIQSLTQGVTGEDLERLKRSLRKVRYVIDVAPEYQGTAGRRYIVSNQPQSYKTSAACTAPAQITFPAHTSIEAAISQIMMMSPQVLEDMSSGDPSTKTKYEFKIHTAIVSEPSRDADGGKDYTVYYKVKRFMTPKTIAYDPAFQVLGSDNPEGTQQSNPEYERIKRNIIEFDYLYTGKNIDVLEFDMKVNMGLAYLQTATLANTFKTQRDRVPNVVTQPSQQSATHAPMQFDQDLVQTPIFFGTQITDPTLINSQAAGASIQSAFTLSKHASLEVAEASMVIVGNDLLLGSTNKTSSPEFVVSGVVEQSTSDSSFHDWADIPAYVKLRIKMPRENDDVALYTGRSTNDAATSTSTQDYARDFWFDGYYYVYGIEHTFDGGVFTQHLHMVGIPKRSAFESTKKVASGEVDLSTRIDNCFSNVVGCSNNSTSNSTSIASTPSTGELTPSNLADATIINRAPAALSDVVGWDKASNAAKSAILKAADRTGVDPVTLARIASHESRFDITANPYTLSSATGLFQFVRSTWNGLIRQGAVTELGPNELVTHTLKKTPPGDPRLDPTLNAYAGAALVKQHQTAIGSSDIGDLYLAHFAGVSLAKKVIAADNAGMGHQPLTAIISSSRYDEMVRANPGVDLSSIRALRVWAARVMSKTIKNPVTVVPSANRAVGTQQNRLTPQAIEQAATQRTRTAAQAISAINNCGVQQDTSLPPTPTCN